MNEPAHRQADDILPADDDLDAFEVAADVLRQSRVKGLPKPVTTTVVGNRIELRLLWPHLLLWMNMLDGYGQADVEDAYVDDGDLMDPGNDHYERGRQRRQMVPLFRQGDFSVHGWTKLGDDGRRQQWVLRPVNERDCRRCVDLPDAHREPVDPFAWRDRVWWDLAGGPWADGRELVR